MAVWHVREAARRFGDRLAVIAPGARWTYAELNERVEAIAGRLAAHGLRPGAIAALWDANGADWVATAHAVWRCGATLLPLSTRLTDAEVRPALDRLDVAMVLGGESFVERAAGWGSPVFTLSSLVEGPTGPLPDEPDPSGLLAMLLTSGTTGAPKAAMLSRSAMEAGARGVSDAIALAPTDRWWLAMPFFHVGGLSALLRCALTGACAVVATRFEPAAALEELAREGVTIASWVPTMAQALLEAKGDRPWPPGLRYAMLGGAATPPSLVAASALVFPSYGLTEACSTVTMARPDAGPDERLSSGRPIPGVEVAILGPDGAELPMGAEGEIAVSGPTVMAGYAGDPTATAAARHGRWLKTGDVGRLDADGCLTVLGRRSDLIVSGGENIYPAEVEAALTAHPSVRQAAVVGMPSARWGASPFAFVSGDVTEAELANWLTERLARFKHPKGYAIVAALPLLANGKVDRRALRSEVSKRGYEAL